MHSRRRRFGKKMMHKAEGTGRMVRNVQTGPRTPPSLTTMLCSGDRDAGATEGFEQDTTDVDFNR